MGALFDLGAGRDLGGRELPRAHIEDPAPVPFVPRSDLAALLAGASLCLSHGNRITALALLWAAVAIAPLDLAAHRRLAAMLANGGDLAGAASEHARYQEFLIARGDLARSREEARYAAATLGALPRPRPIPVDAPERDPHDPAVRLSRYVSRSRLALPGEVEPSRSRSAQAFGLGPRSHTGPRWATALTE